MKEIQLNAEEQKICSLLKEYCAYYNQENPSEESLELRITGGWVRDKLLGKASNDLDIAINFQSGEIFTENLIKYIKKGNYPNVISTSVHKIEKNPEKSKHLETCTTKIYGLDVDFVNLRSEEYTADSRIPIVDYGTPEQDAMRRDATLNALFFNLNTEKVEDFTGKGLEDLEQGILRTPLPAMQTFLDDPLRCLRLIRFAAQYNFRIDDEALKCMSEPEIQTSLLRKISKERVGVELDKMLKSQSPTYGISLIRQTDLYKPIFNFGELYEKVLEYNDGAGDFISHRYELTHVSLTNLTEKLPSVLEELAKVSLFEEEVNLLKTDKAFAKTFYLVILLYNWSGLTFKTRPQKSFKTTQSAVEIIVKEGLKYSSKESDLIRIVVDSSSSLQQVLSAYQKNPDSFKRSDLGLLIKPFGQNAKVCLFCNLVQECFEGDLAEVFTRYATFMQALENLDLWDAHLLRPLVNGKELLIALNRKPGPWVSHMNDKLVVWQLDNPKAAKEQVAEYAKTIIDQVV